MKTFTIMKSYTTFSNIKMDIILIITICLNIFYFYKLDNELCTCITDWRHNFIKYSSYVLLLWELFVSILRKTNPDKMHNQGIYNTIRYVIFVLYIIYFAVFFNYIGEINTTKCSCAIDNQPKLNTFLYYYRYLPVIILCLMLIYPILFILGFIYHGGF